MAAGVNELGDVEFDVKAERELRTEARKAAVAAARESVSAGVLLGFEIAG